MSIDPALALAIARRESEFNPRVASPVGAQGLMQLMPATAREVAGNLGLPYSKSRLTSDPNYNAILGITYLEELQDRLGNTPAMIAAGYNAGPARPQNWAEEYGDPRTGGLDVVDYIEMIPFRETRNYVMRVTESLPVYRARLTGTAVEPEFTKLLIGALPDVLSRPSVATPAPTSDVTLEFAAPQTTQVGIRPRARPGTTGPIAADQIPGQTTNLETVLTPEAEAVPETPTRATETAAPQITPPQTAPLTSVRPQPRPRLQWSEIIVRRGTQISREPTSPTRISGPSGPSAAGN
jgi:soluble lytic murein transglycosylase